MWTITLLLSSVTALDTWVDLLVRADRLLRADEVAVDVPAIVAPLFDVLAADISVVDVTERIPHDLEQIYRIHIATTSSDAKSTVVVSLLTSMFEEKMCDAFLSLTPAVSVRLLQAFDSSSSPISGESYGIPPVARRAERAAPVEGAVPENTSPIASVQEGLRTGYKVGDARTLVVMNLNRSSTAADCHVVCNEDPDCDCFTFKERKNGNRRCSLKRRLFSTHSASGCEYYSASVAAGRKSIKGIYNRSVLRHSFTLQVSTVKRLEKINNITIPEDCSAKCTEKTGCDCWFWRYDTRGTRCTLMEAVGNVRQEGCVMKPVTFSYTSGVKALAEKTTVRRGYTFRYVGTIWKASTRSADGCHDKCTRSRSGCSCFVWTGRKCHLFKNVGDEGCIFLKVGSVAGVKSQEGLNSWDKRDHMLTNAQPIDVSSTWTAGQCATRCVQRHACECYVWTLRLRPLCELNKRKDAGTPCGLVLKVDANTWLAGLKSSPGLVHAMDMPFLTEMPRPVRSRSSLTHPRSPLSANLATPSIPEIMDLIVDEIDYGQSATENPVTILADDEPDNWEYQTDSSATHTHSPEASRTVSTLTDCSNLETEFRCRNGYCIPLVFKCDGDNDCEDGSDEESCFKFQCDDSIKLILQSQVCDTEEDCPDGSDEKYCGLEGEVCWTQCNKSSGPCDFCGSGYKCCRKNWNGGEKGCHTDEGAENHHVCVTRSVCDDETARTPCTCPGSASTVCAIGETCISGSCTQPSCTIPVNITTLIKNAVDSSCSTTLNAGASCVVTCATGYAAAGSGLLQCGTSMGKLSIVPGCFVAGVEGKANIYVQSKITLTVDITNPTKLLEPAFKTVMVKSIAASLNVEEARTEILNVSLVTRRRLFTARRLAATSVEVDFRVHAADRPAQGALQTAISSNVSTFTTNILAQVKTKSSESNIELVVSSVDVQPATVVTVFEAVNTQGTSSAPIAPSTMAALATAELTAPSWASVPAVLGVLVGLVFLVGSLYWFCARKKHVSLEALQQEERV
eukprot:GEMP01009917.1.p1 GENE.GEMP01009917.1~~GEMP01009917.1.p1  ORF type:complete len:1021 (+),score=128.40 GEMP01009917.1:160-3222(+)